MLIADIGSTTTKVMFVEGDKIIAREESKTTVESPDNDVSIGLHSAIDLIKHKTNIDIGGRRFIFSSSAGGGLQMVAIGLTNNYTAKSAFKVCVNSGAIVIDTLAFDDGRTPLQRLTALDQAKPDLIMFAGGFESGAIDPMIEMAELLILSKIHGKFENSRLPVIYAGNSKALPFISKILENNFNFQVVPNITPSENEENFTPAKNAIVDVFINHVMSSAPGYKTLLERSNIQPLPTPVAVEKILSLYSQERKSNIYAFDIGGATTDCFSIARDKQVRSVAANLGMTYSLPCVLNQCGLKKIMDRLKNIYSKDEVLNFIGDRYARPTTVTDSARELAIEEAIVQCIITESFAMHQTMVKMNYDLVIASGGFIAHYPRKENLKKLIRKTLRLSPFTKIALDTLFILPHLGVLSQVDRSLALKLFKEYVVII